LLMIFLLSRASGPGCVAVWTTYRCVRISGATSKQGPVAEIDPTLTRLIEAREG